MKKQQKDIEASKKAQDQALGQRVLLVKRQTARSDESIRGQIDEEVDTYCEEMSEAEEELDKILAGLGDAGKLVKALQALLKYVEKK